MSKQIIVGYKAIRPDSTCSGYNENIKNENIKIGKTYKCDESFYFCKKPLDVLKYYPASERDYPIVDDYGKPYRFALIIANQKDVEEREDGYVTNKVADITFFKELTVADIIEDHIKWFNQINKRSVEFETHSTVIDECSGYTTRTHTLIGDYSELALSDDEIDDDEIDIDEQIHIISTVPYSQIVTSSLDVSMMSTGDHALLVSDNSRALLSSSGDGATIISTGVGNELTAIGNHSQITAFGYKSILFASGDHSLCVALGEDSVISLMGKASSFVGVKGVRVVAANYDDRKCIGFIEGCIGENGLKENTMYRVSSNGEFVEWGV